MFDFVISGNQERRPVKRIFASWVTSCLAHCIALLLLWEYPELLRGGIYQHYFHRILEPQEKDDSQNWYTVAVLQPKMSMPSAETLKKLLSDPKEKAPGTKPIHIRMDDIKAVLSDQPAKPKTRPDTKDSLPSLTAREAASPGSGSAASASGNSGLLDGKQSDGNASKQPTISLPPPGPESKSAVASNNLDPSKIPNPVLTPSETPTTAAKIVKAPEGDIKAIRSPESIFDPNETKGFPMGEYTSHIVELIKEKWFIPSYLKDSHGHTTVAFHIDKNGRTLNVRILAGSGSNSLDIAALDAVLSCSLPALPRGFPGDHVGARFVFSYNEHQ
jgi:TonB family protein